MTEFQFELLQSLSKASMYPGGFDKAFVRNLARKEQTFELSDKQAEWLLRLAYKYRRQLSANFHIPKPTKINDLVTIHD